MKLGRAHGAVRRGDLCGELSAVRCAQEGWLGKRIQRREDPQDATGERNGFCEGRLQARGSVGGEKVDRCEGRWARRSRERGMDGRAGAWRGMVGRGWSGEREHGEVLSLANVRGLRDTHDAEGEACIPYGGMIGAEA